jgi:hypothetical protein
VEIHLSPSDGIPIYVQIVNQVKYLVASGRLAPGRVKNCHPSALWRSNCW